MGQTPPCEPLKVLQEGVLDARLRESKSQSVGVQVSRGVHPQVPSTSIVQGATAAFRGTIPDFGTTQAEPNRRRPSAPGPRPHADLDSAEACRGSCGGIPEGEVR